jgi:cytochrome c biogenesis protein CcmG/thiol:disulfide interchange protein DsbE
MSPVLTSWRRRAAGAVLLTLAAAALASCHKTSPVEIANLGFTLKDMNGHDVRLADFKGKALLVNFWSTTCGPCQLETPELVDLAAKYKERGLAVVGISIDDTPADIRTFANQYKVPYPLLVGADRDEVTQAFGLGDAIPMSVFITSKGTVYGRIEGLATQSWYERQIQALLPDTNPF